MKIFAGTQKGFSLMELMITVAIMGILASIVVPSYNDYVKQGMATTATATLADARIQLEQCYQDTRSYNDAACAAACPPASANSFAFTCTRNADTYDLSATGSGKVAGFSFAIDEANVMSSTYDGVSGSCWKTSKGSAC